MQGQPSPFEVYVLGLLAVLERLPVPIAISFDRRCERVQGNHAYRRLTGAEFHFESGGHTLEPEELPLQRAARVAVEVVDFGMRLVRGDGNVFDLAASAWPLGAPGGEVHGSVGVFVDVTQSKEAEKRAQHAMEALVESERRYRIITEAMPEFVWLDGADGSAIYANRRWLDYTGLTPSENLGFGWERVVHPDDRVRLRSDRERTLRTGEPYEGECRYRGKDGKYRWFLFRSIAVRDESGAVTSWLGTATDIDKQKRAEAQQTFFALASDVLGSTLDVGGTLERIARLAIASLGTWCQIDMPDNHGRLRAALVAHQDAAKQAQLEQLLDQYVYDDDAQLGPSAVFRTLEPQLLPRVDENAVTAVIPHPAHRDVYRRIGYASGMIVPLRIRDRVLGTLGIASDDATRLYTEFDLSTALELGRRGAIALENARLFEREHHVATTLQRALLPSVLPSSAEVSFSSAYSAAASAQGEAVGGDWYDAFPADGGRIAISVGDVAGHGVEAAVTMGVVRQAIRSAALEHHAPREVLLRANRVLTLEQRDTMITAFFGVYDPKTRALSYSIAGHPRPMFVNDAGAVNALDGAGPPLGQAFDESLLDERTVTLPNAATAVFYTDGLIEYARDLLEAESRLEHVLSSRHFLLEENPAQAIIDGVLNAAQRDDIAVLVMHVADPQAKELNVTMPAIVRNAPILRKRLRDFARAQDLDDEAVFRVLGASGEALANAVEHAYDGRQTGPVTVRASFDEEGLLVEISDAGTWRCGDHSTMRGHGTGIMKSLVREMEIDRSENGTTVRLRF